MFAVHIIAISGLVLAYGYFKGADIMEKEGRSETNTLIPHLGIA